MARFQSGNFARPDEVRVLAHGWVELETIGEESVGRQVLEPGWCSSLHVTPLAGTQWCEFYRFRLVVAGRLHVEMSDGTSWRSARLGRREFRRSRGSSARRRGSGFAFEDRGRHELRGIVGPREVFRLADE